MTAKQLSKRISELALAKKGDDIIIMDLQNLSDIADFFVLISCESDIHVKTLANHIEDKLKEEKIKPLHKEGFTNLNWVLLDFVDVIVHIFRQETRAYYSLEKLWADAKMTKVEDDAPARVVSESAN